MHGFSQETVLGVLLILNLGAFRGTAARRSRCLSEKQLEDKFDKFNQRRAPYLSLLSEPTTAPRRQTCEQVARQTSHMTPRHRALSPWRYRMVLFPLSIYHDQRLPYSIVQAECLCQGCIINQQEDMSYNSVPVFAPLLVLIKSRCLNDPNKYTLKRKIVQIPVACTCVVPRSY
ncbi:interleukin-17C-like [Synchiropus splendidus]|uniref:interleukin-17C-like n=1 Tax=Synchiropus splendidus TaxID=270530 RepID=UPI00237DFF4D|nr:interleukin-17C-like [Synchiropus splendidus]